MANENYNFYFLQNINTKILIGKATFFFAGTST